MEIITPIIPVKQQFVKLKNVKHNLDTKAICCFAATGFFLDDSTYWKDTKVLMPGTKNVIDSQGYLIRSDPWFTWHYTPSSNNYETVLEEFTELFEEVIDSQTNQKNVILPLSGGIDSRTQAVAFRRLKKQVNTFSYSFENGFQEHLIAEKIAKKCNFQFQKFIVKRGYLWHNIEDLVKINGGYAEFTHCRQMAFIDQYKVMGEIFSLGHWGDVLFDDVKVPDNLTFEKQVDIIYKKIVKPGGLELGNVLWDYFEINGNFKEYLSQKIRDMLKSINIEESANSQIRAFKSKYWAPRWTSINLGIFDKAQPISLPYYDDRICQFICNVKEEFLSGRKIQIDYIQEKAPDLASIPWQDHYPYNLNNYHQNRLPHNLPSVIKKKFRRLINMTIGKEYIQRNWELQFIGHKNQAELCSRLMIENFVPKKIKLDFLNKFNFENKLIYAHSLSILLTFSMWSDCYNKND